MTTTSAKPDKDTRNLVMFEYGDLTKAPKYALYTDWTDDVYWEGHLYKSSPKLELQLPELTGTIADERAVIFLEEDAFAAGVCSLEPHSPVRVEIQQLSTRAEGDEFDRIWLYKGNVESGEANAEDKDGRYKIECLTWKSNLGGKAGLPATGQCQNVFASGIGCQYDREAQMRPGTITVVQGTKCTITGLPAQTGTWWNRGIVRLDGLEIQIRHWNAGSQTIFYLTSFPPAAWHGAVVEVLPGCERILSKCGVFGQLENFMGFGRKIPKHNPNYEAPGA